MLFVAAVIALAVLVGLVLGSVLTVAYTLRWWWGAFAAKPGVTATDVVLTITEMLRKHGVVGKFVEFYGAGVAAVPLANRAIIGNMSPEFGSTCAMFSRATANRKASDGAAVVSIRFNSLAAPEGDTW